MPEQAQNTPKTMTVPEAGRQYYDLCPRSSYAAVARGEIPVIRVGRLLRVPIAAMERLMEQGGAGAKAK